MLRKLSVVAALTALFVIAPLSPAAYAAATPSHTSAVTVTVSAWPAPTSTYSGIAATVCHNTNLWPNIARDNNAHAPYWLRIGQRIVVRCAVTASSGSNSPIRASSWVTPVPGATCISGFRTASRPRHNGIDLPRAYGTPIHAAAAGTVTIVRYQAGGAGWYVMLNHGTYQTVYMHMNRQAPVRVGQHVAANQVIGYVGATGDASGPHLHFEVHHGAWNQISPVPFMRAHGVTIRGC